MQTKDFKTRSEIVVQKSPSNEFYYPIGLDVGYSGVKVYTENKRSCFPSFTRKAPDNTISFRNSLPTDIQLFMDGETWDIGELAYDGFRTGDSSVSEVERSERDRYYSNTFRAISLTGIGIALLENEISSIGDRKILIQTGLPAKYMDDAPYLIDALSGDFSFKIRLGGGDWNTFSFSLGEDNFLKPLPQPIGALLSAAYNKDGTPSKIASQLFNLNTVILDPGGNTFDLSAIIRGRYQNDLSKTYPELGMRAVFERTCQKIREKYNVSLTVTALQKKLEEGTIKTFDRKARSSASHDFSDLLEESRKEVFEEVIKEVDSSYKFFTEYNYAIASGGTYEIWKDDFADLLKNIEGLQIIPANINDPSIPNFYSVSRGYYYMAANGRASKKG